MIVRIVRQHFQLVPRAIILHAAMSARPLLAVYQVGHATLRQCFRLEDPPGPQTRYRKRHCRVKLTIDYMASPPGVEHRT